MNPASCCATKRSGVFAYASISGTWALLVIAAVAILFSVLFDNPGNGNRRNSGSVSRVPYRGPR